MKAVSRVEQAALLQTTRADLVMLDGLRGSESVWLTVNPPEPERLAVLFDALVLYRACIDGAARLLVVAGVDAPPSNQHGLVERAAQAGLAVEVEIIVEPAARKAAFLVADALVLCSPDEQAELDALAIGVPIVRAGPVLARERANGACLAWDEPTAPLLAASVATLRSNAGLRMQLRERGFVRWRHARTAERSTPDEGSA
jgi:hypothetical protein